MHVWTHTVAMIVIELVVR